MRSGKTCQSRFPVVAEVRHRRAVGDGRSSSCRVVAVALGASGEHFVAVIVGVGLSDSVQRFGETVAVCVVAVRARVAGTGLAGELSGEIVGVRGGHSAYRLARHLVCEVVGVRLHPHICARGRVPDTYRDEAVGGVVAVLLKWLVPDRLA